MRHAFLYTLVRMRTRRALRADGYGLWQVGELMDGCEDEVIDLAVAQADQRSEGRVSAALAAQPVLGLGDGKILEWLTEFLNSELGKLLIEVLKALLLSLLVV